MSEKGRPHRGSGHEKDPTQIPRHQKIQDEEDRFIEVWQEIDNSPDGEDLDPEKFLRDMAILDELHPLPDFDLSSSWKDFQEKYAHLLASSESADQQSSASDSAERPKRKRSRTSFRGVIAVGLILAMLMTAASCGVIERILKAIGNWTEDVFGFQLTQELRVDVPTPENTDIVYYDSLEEALAAYGVTTKYAEIQFPSGYVFHDVRVADLYDSIKILAKYTKGNDEIAFTIWHYKDSTSLEFSAAEKLPPEADIYLRNGIEYYILENSETTTVSWITGIEKYSLLGDYSADEAKLMIDSIYKG